MSILWCIMQHAVHHQALCQDANRHQKTSLLSKAKQLNNKWHLVISTGGTPQIFSYPSQAIKILYKYYMIVSFFGGMSFKLSSSIGRSAIRLVQEKDSIMSLSFACSSNGSFPGVVVQISVLCSVCFLGR